MNSIDFKLRVETTFDFNCQFFKGNIYMETESQKKVVIYFLENDNPVKEFSKHQEMNITFVVDGSNLVLKGKYSKVFNKISKRGQLLWVIAHKDIFYNIDSLNKIDTDCSFSPYSVSLETEGIISKEEVEILFNSKFDDVSVAELEYELKIAIQKEDFESASKIRDEIKKRKVLKNK